MIWLHQVGLVLLAGAGGILIEQHHFWFAVLCLAGAWHLSQTLVERARRVH